MPRHQYQGTPAQPPNPIATIRSGSVAAEAGTKFLWLQYRNRSGFSLPSVSAVQIDIGTGQGIDVVIPEAALPSPNGAYIWEYILLMGDTSDIGDACVVATHPGYESDQQTAQEPPFTISLVRDEHFKLSATVTYASQLPTGGDRLHGMRRSVDTDDTYLTEDRPSFQGKIVEWDQIAGVWVICRPSIFNTNIGNIIGILGANQDTADIPDFGIVIYPDYSMASNTESIAVGYWLVNDGTQDIAAGTRIGVTVENGAEDVSYALGILGGVSLTFRGYVDVDSGVLDRTDEGGINDMPDIDVAIPYQGKKTGLSLPKALPPNTAYWIDVRVKITPALLNNRIAQGASLGFVSYFYADFAVWNPAGNQFGDFIAADFGRRRILPSAGLTAVAQSGSGNIILSTGGSLSFYGIGAQTVTGFQSNANNQTVWIGVDGTCLVAPVQPNGTRKRAIVSTVNGAGFPTSWSAPVALDNTKLLSVTLTYPTAIRSNYPDVIAGTAAELNAIWLRIYVRSTSTNAILQYEELVVPGDTQNLLIGSIAGTNIGTTLPVPGNANFGLFEISGFSTTTQFGDSDFATGNYEVALAFRYNGTITSISHDPVLGCIPEIGTTLADALDRLKYYAQPTTDFEGIPLALINPWQSRINPATGERFTFNPNAYTGIKPSAISDSDPGRWQKEFSLDGGDILTQILIYGD